ncbi:MAG: type IV secretion system protein [Novosphingobium sp.]
MSCAAIPSGSHFLGGVLDQIDCQAQTIGAYGFGALASPNSAIAGLLLAALTLFVALFGIRLMFGEVPSGRDVVGEMLKVGIVLTLATSWPAWRTLAYETVFQGSSAIAGDMGSASGLPGSRGDFNQRLDNLDQGIVALTAYGTGRLTGGVVGTSDAGDMSRGIALPDRDGFAWGRVAFLTGTIAPLAVVRLGAGILLALAPLMAALLLFAGTRDIFFGWLRALGACALGALVLMLLYGAEISMLEGWLAGVLATRSANVLAVAAPTELVALTLAFAAAIFGSLTLIVRLVFFSSPNWRRWLEHAVPQELRQVRNEPALVPAMAAGPHELPRARQVADAVEQVMRRESRLGDPARQLTDLRLGEPLRGQGSAPQQEMVRDALGSSHRRGSRRSSAAATRRDG